MIVMVKTTMFIIVVIVPVTAAPPVASPPEVEQVFQKFHFNLLELTLSLPHCGFLPR